jgi:transcriptional regulator with XRE-family HTH domain
MIDRAEPWRILGETMRSVRQGAGWTLTAAATELGYSKSHLSLVEQGKDRPSDELVHRYDTYFQAAGLLSSLYLAARTPRLGREPMAWSRPPFAHAAEPAGDTLSAFVCDVTIPDGSIVTVREALLKTWRIRNVGTTPWRGCRLVRFGPCDGPALLASPPEMPIPDTAPGREVDITVSLRAPARPGATFALWKMLDADGNLLFPDLRDGLYVLVIVVEAENGQVVHSK